MSVLADTSVWIDHFRRGNPEFVSLLEEGEAVIHPFILGELACGNLSQRETTLRLLSDLPHVDQATHTEVLFLIEERNQMSKGLGYIDVHLLTSAMIAGITLWTLDKRLMEIANSLGVSWSG